MADARPSFEETYPGYVCSALVRLVATVGAWISARRHGRRNEERPAIAAADDVPSALA